MALPAYLCINHIQSVYYASVLLFFFKRPNLALSLRVSLFPSRDFWQTGAIFRSDRVLNDSSCSCHVIKMRLLQFPAGCPEWGPLCGLQLAQGPLKGGIWSKHPLPGSHCVPCHSNKIYPESINGHLFSPGWISHSKEPGIREIGLWVTEGLTLFLLSGAHPDRLLLVYPAIPLRWTSRDSRKIENKHACLLLLSTKASLTLLL